MSIGANVGISALSAKVGAQKTVSEEKLRHLRKKQEGILHDLSANLPIWKLYGWTDFFVDKLNGLTVPAPSTIRVYVRFVCRSCV